MCLFIWWNTIEWSGHTLAGCSSLCNTAPSRRDEQYLWQAMGVSGPQPALWPPPPQPARPSRPWPRARPLSPTRAPPRTPLLLLPRVRVPLHTDTSPDFLIVVTLLCIDCALFTSGYYCIRFPRWIPHSTTIAVNIAEEACWALLKLIDSVSIIRCSHHEF